MSFASLLSPILVQDNRNLRLQVADGHPKPLDGRTKAAYVHPKPANGDFASASRRIYVGSFEVSSVLLEDVRCTFARVFRFSWKAYACYRQSLVRFWGWFWWAYWGMLVGCGGEVGRLRGQAVQTVANESGAPTSWRPTQCYLNQISSYQIETVSTIQINLMKIY